MREEGRGCERGECRCDKADRAACDAAQAGGSTGREWGALGVRRACIRAVCAESVHGAAWYRERVVCAGWCGVCGRKYEVRLAVVEGGVWG